jgi:hypothetical protein
MIMTRNFFSVLILWIICTFLLLFCFVVITSAQSQKARPAHIGFIYPLSSNGAEAPQLTNNFSFHVLAGVSHQENSFCLSGITSLVKKNAFGVMISGVSNHIGNDAKGFQIAGVLNQIKNDAEGVQMAGVANVTGNANGAQIAGFTNVARNVSGTQVAGFANSAKDVDAQVAGFANIAKNAEAVQVAGFINVAKDAGNQVAGFINVAKKVKGVQIAGFINIAEESNYPIGLINIIRNGERQIGLSIDEMGTTLLSFRSGGKVLYGILGAGYNFREDNARYALEGGIGAHFPISKAFRLNAEVVTSALSDMTDNVYFKSSCRILAALKVANRIEFFAGPSFNHLGYDRDQDDIMNDNYIWSRRNYNYFNGFFIGVTGGIQVNL